MVNITILPINASDREWIAQVFQEHWGSDKVISRGVVHYPQSLPGFVALYKGEKVGLVTYNIVEGSCEIVTLNSTHPTSGVGTDLIEAVRDIAINSGCKRLWLITTNDNMHALRFYQRRGLRLSALRVGAVDEARRTLKPEIGEVGSDRIPIRDELELELQL